MQKRKSLLMKLLVLLTAVCCTLAIAFGVVGCADKPKDGVGIQKAELNAKGDLVLTFTNGDSTVLDITLGTLGETCEDGKGHDLATHTVRHANCAQGGLVFNLCSKCGGYNTLETEKNEAVHGYYTTELEKIEVGGSEYLIENYKFVSYGTEAGDHQDATCLDGGFDHIICSKCEATLSEEYTDPLGHNYQKVTGAKENGNICMDGSFEAYVCLRCMDVAGVAQGYPDPIYTPAAEHHTADSTWTVKNQPAEDAEGLIEGVCTVCKEMATITLPKLSDTTIYKVDVPTCADALNGEEIKTVYSFIAEDGYYGFKEEFKFDTEVFHIVSYNGEEYEFSQGVTYDYADIKDLIGNGISWDAGVAANCNEGSHAIIDKCAKCEQRVIIEAKGSHNWVAQKDAEGNVVYTEATCEKAKFHVEVCSTCNASREILVGEPKGHYWEKAGEAVKNNDGTVTINADCRDCEKTTTITGTLNAEKSTTATCKKAATNVYDYTINGEAKTIEIVEGDPVGHKVVGKDAYFFHFSSGVEYDYDAIKAYLGNEITWDGGKPADCNEASLAILYPCEFCEQKIIINAKGPHDWKDVVDTEGNKIYTEATCEEGRYYTQACACDGCTETKKIYEGQAALEHPTWELIELVGEGEVEGTVVLSVKCTTCGKEDTITGTYNEEKSKAVTCLTDEIKAYDYVINDKNETLNVIGEKATGHKLTGADVEFEVEHNGKVHTCVGKICDNCEELIISSIVPPIV